jgi:transcriptional regulator with XRE-family HTH domain
MNRRIGKRLKDLRLKRGYTVRHLAELLNMNFSYLSRVENEKKIPSLELLEQIAEFFNVDISYFFMK